MPDAEDGTGQGCCGVKVHDGKAGGHAGVLHTDFNRNGTRLAAVQMQQTGGYKAQGKAEGIVQDDDSRHGKTDCCQFACGECHHTADQQNNADYRYQRHGGHDFLGGVFHKVMYQQAENDRCQYHLGNGNHHGHEGNVNPCAREEIGQRRRYDGR